MKKRIISAVLALCLIMSLIPTGVLATDKSGITIEYDIMSHKGESGSLREILTYDTTNGFFTWAAASANGLAYHNNSPCIELSAGHWIIFKINVPVAGKYDIKIKNHVGNTGKYLDAYVFSDTVTPNADVLSDSNYIGSVDCNKTTGKDGK